MISYPLVCGVSYAYTFETHFSIKFCLISLYLIVFFSLLNSISSNLSMVFLLKLCFSYRLYYIQAFILYIFTQIVFAIYYHAPLFFDIFNVF